MGFHRRFVSLNTAITIYEKNNIEGLVNLLTKNFDSLSSDNRSVMEVANYLQNNNIEEAKKIIETWKK